VSLKWRAAELNAFPKEMDLYAAITGRDVADRMEDTDEAHSPCALGMQINI
jgi:hypothetical protein